MFFPMIFGGRICSFDEILAVSGTGTFTFDYAYPYLYVCDETVGGVGKILIYDVSSGITPVLLSTTDVPTTSGPRNPVIDGDTLYVPYRQTNKLALWNVANRSAPVLLGSVVVSYQPWCVAVIGTVAAVGFGQNFTKTILAEKIDCSNPASPTVVDSILSSALATAAGSTSTHFLFAGQLTSGGQTYIITVDVSGFNITDQVNDALATAGIFQDMVVSEDGNHAYSTNNGNVIINSFDISDPANIVLLDQATYGGSAVAQVLCLVDDTDRLYVGPANSTIRIMDVSDPSNMSHVGNISTGGDAVSDMVNTDGCPGFCWGQGTGAAIHLIGTAPTS